MLNDSRWMQREEVESAGGEWSGGEPDSIFIVSKLGFMIHLVYNIITHQIQISSSNLINE